MATGPPAFQSDPKIDLFKLRAAEYRERYESMRNLEWKVLFQIYAGYAAIAAAVSHLHALKWEVPRREMVGTLVFFFATQYLYVCIQERLINFNATQENWMKHIYRLLGADSALDPGPGTEKLWHKYFWTYDIQLFLASLTTAALLSYEAGLANKNPKGLLIGLNILVVVCALTLKSFAEWRRIQSGVYRSRKHNAA
jgi:hypothetical protein